MSNLLDISTQLLSHHLLILERAGLISAVKNGPHKSFYRNELNVSSVLTELQLELQKGDPNANPRPDATTPT
jgi:predicted transcriptional regulator